MHLILPYFIILLVVLQILLRKGVKTQKQRDQEFWEREARANTVRRKDISNLNYISIPANLPVNNCGNAIFDEIFSKNTKLVRAMATIESLRDKKILNLTGISNTDLKLEYGVANLTELSEYDDNFTELAKAVSVVGHILLDENDLADATTYLEYGIEIGSDISSNYVDLAIIYAGNKETSKLLSLKDRASMLNSLSKEVIIRQLNDIIEKHT